MVRMKLDFVVMRIMETAWFESKRSPYGLSVVRVGNPNDQVIRSKANNGNGHSHWFALRFGFGGRKRAFQRGDAVSDGYR
jgi:hypothetical protein